MQSFSTYINSTSTSSTSTSSTSTGCGSSAASKDRKRAIRRDKKHARRALSQQQQTTAARQLARSIASSLPFLRANRVALYWPHGGEISPLDLLKHRLAPRKQWYLPVIDGQEMQFFQFHPGQPLRRNRYGIAEPQVQSPRGIKAWQLDLIIVPLVAFDAQRNRLGMGGGFYDRYLAANTAMIKRPYLIGVGHECQQVAALPLESWDVKLDAVVTDRHWY